MYRWCARHGRLVFWLWILFSLVIVLPLVLFNQLSIIWFSLYMFYMVFVIWGFVNSCARKLLNNSVAKLNSCCDPAPLLQEVHEQSAYSRSKTYNQILLINKCVAWREMGQFDQVLQTLEHLNIDQYSGTLPQTKVVYYNNLADAFIEMKDAEKAMLWLTKASQIAADLKNRKVKMILQDSLLLNYAGIANLRGQYDEAERLLLQNTGKAKPLRRNVSDRKSTRLNSSH